MSKQYVCHISGQGEKWQVNHVGSYDYQVQGCGNIHYLPKSEYRLCPAPEVWLDVTESFDPKDDYAITINPGYRLRKVPICTGDGYKHEPTKQWAFIVEKKVSE